MTHISITINQLFPHHSNSRLLILEEAEQHSILNLAHDETSQRDQLQATLAKRNKQMEGIGQENYTHACDLCFIITEDEGKQSEYEIQDLLFKHLKLLYSVKFQAAVCDGNTIGHPCCAIHDCKGPLMSHRHRFCAEHHHHNMQCAITECCSATQPGFKTCSIPEHRALEKAYFQRGTALFQLRDRLKKAGVSVPVNSISLPESEKDFVDDDEVLIETTECSGKPEDGNQKVKAYFGRRRTHNEQIIMRPCGVILSRATFFGSEAISSVNVFF
jgi:CxC6 like cysteine cluster associated with KDZ transposases